MRKHNEGYVLAMVMVVIAVLALVASIMLSMGLNNVQTQQAYVERMQEKYEAEGQLEVVVASLNALESQLLNGNIDSGAVKTAIENVIKPINGEVKDSKLSKWQNINSNQSDLLKKYKFEYEATLLMKSMAEPGETETVMVTVEIKLDGTVANVANGVETGSKIDFTNILFESYETEAAG